MGLLTIIRKNRIKEKEMRVLFLGLDNAGKTTILKKLNGEDITSISPTLGFNIKSFGYKGYTLNVWDVGGQKTLRPYWRNYFESTDAVVWVVDSSDGMRIEDCRNELNGLLKEDVSGSCICGRSFGHVCSLVFYGCTQRLAGATLLVFANKQDLPGSMPLDDIRNVSLESLLAI